jgi:Nitrate and nitrite sensing
MGLRLRSIRQRIFLLVLVPVLSVIGLYIFATSIAAGNAISLAHANTLRNATGEPTGAFLSALDAERPLALVYLSSPTGANLALLEAQESKTNTAVTGLRAALTSSATKSDASAGENAAIAALLKDAASLPALRSQTASQIITRSRAFSEYNSIVMDGYSVLDEAILQETNAPVVAQSLAFVQMGRSEEMLLREDALLVGDLAARSFTASDRQQFTELVGARRTIYSETLPSLDPVYRAYYQKDVNPQALASLAALENQVVSSGTAEASPPRVDPAAWQQVVGGVSAGLSEAGTQASALITARAGATARSTDLRLILVGGLGLLAVLLSLFVSVWIGRNLVRELAALRQSALELANHHLPSVVRRLAAGEDVDVSAETPEVPASNSDEIGQVRQAFASVQQTAVQAAVGQARLRRGINDIFRNLARRSQSLLHRQLTLLDAMEASSGDPDQLADLFRIDHLTTRMRRHAESLIILSGDAPARGWRNPVLLVDVLRAAVAEVEDYTRIKVSAATQAALAGPAVGDVIHLIAELAENAAIFSPPNTPVQISGDIVGRGFAVEIEDRGLGLSEEKLAEINDRLANPARFRPVRQRSARAVRGQPARQAARHPDLAASLALRGNDRDRPHPGRPGGARGHLRPRSLGGQGGSARDPADRPARSTGRRGQPWPGIHRPAHPDGRPAVHERPGGNRPWAGLAGGTRTAELRRGGWFAGLPGGGRRLAGGRGPVPGGGSRHRIGDPAGLAARPIALRPGGQGASDRRPR